MDEAEGVVQGAAAQWKPRVTCLHGDFQALLERPARVEKHHVALILWLNSKTHGMTEGLLAAPYTVQPVRYPAILLLVKYVAPHRMEEKHGHL